jgi:hypothetical protein
VKVTLESFNAFYAPVEDYAAKLNGEWGAAHGETGKYNVMLYRATGSSYCDSINSGANNGGIGSQVAEPSNGTK